MNWNTYEEIVWIIYLISSFLLLLINFFMLCYFKSITRLFTEDLITSPKNRIRLKIAVLFIYIIITMSLLRSLVATQIIVTVDYFHGQLDPQYDAWMKESRQILSYFRMFLPITLATTLTQLIAHFAKE